MKTLAPPSYCVLLVRSNSPCWLSPARSTGWSMVAFWSRNIVKLLYSSVLAGSVFALSNSAFASTVASVASKAQSVFAQEQALSPTQLLDRWSPLIKEASRRFGVAEAWIRAVMRLESGGRTALDDKKPITSHAGAMGIMQVMPETYEEMRRQH